MPETRWLPFEDCNDSTFSDEQAMSCYMGKIYYFWQRRNAFYGYESNLYPGNKAFYLELDELKEEIESQRVSGTRWVIEELPALIIAGIDDALVVAEINCTNPLHIFLPFRKSISSLNEFGIHFDSEKPNSVVRFICESEAASPARFPFLHYDSVSYGGNRRLNWKSSNSIQEIDHVLKLVSRISMAIQRKHASPLFRP